MNNILESINVEKLNVKDLALLIDIITKLNNSKNNTTNDIEVI